ncbi:7-cyano-7-deazaguanine synthase QueC [Pelotomaculum propionicicum]|uniref:7-cyano-7-deazaguanine synthase QueC n=1 Tax=Pelotomaculum propionicicum TaxID=258475 RepID=UPI003B76B897
MKSIVLLSGGLDSAVSLVQAIKETEVLLCLTFDYGQRSAQKERESAAFLAAYYKVKHRLVKLGFLENITKTALVAAAADIPEPEQVDLDDYNKSKAAAAAVWVPNRNGLFINIAAAFAEANGCEIIVAGFNREEAATFPDNSVEFVNAANSALSYSTLNKVKLVSYTQPLDKIEIIKQGMKEGLPFQHIWSCYRGEDKMCGRCESCRRFQRAAKAAGLAGDFFINS